MVKFKITISKLGELQGHPSVLFSLPLLGLFAAKFISIPPHVKSLSSALEYLWCRNKNVQRLASE